MNIAVTQCPACATRFNVSEAQLEARDGLVRCGRCETVFNAAEHLLPDEPSPQLSLPIDEVAVAAEISAELPLPPDSDARSEHFIPPEIPANTSTGALAPPADLSGLDDPPATLAQQVQFHTDEPEADQSPAAPRRRRRVLPLILGLLLCFLLLAQAAYFFRAEIALRLPGLKPLLVQLCEPLSCTIPLPRDADLLAIESSELEADATHPGVFTLHVVLRNHAPHAQALPDLELTLTHLNERVIARRMFPPAAYLQGPDARLDALAAKRELSLALPLQTSELRPTGYRLLLFYPEQP